MKKVIFLSLFLFFSFSKALELDYDYILKKYFYSKIDFIQKTYIKDLDEIQEFKGIIYIKKPDFRVDYSYPYKQTILVKKDKIYIYNPEDNQLIITSASQDLVILNVLNILSGKSDIEDFFKIKKEEDRIILIPKNYKDIKKIEILIKNKEIKQINLEDKNGNISQIHIKNVDFNKNIEIELKLPKDVNIINY